MSVERVKLTKGQEFMLHHLSMIPQDSTVLTHQSRRVMRSLELAGFVEVGPLGFCYITTAGRAALAGEQP